MVKHIVPELSRTDALELVAEQRKEFRLIGSQKRLPGLILFEYDLTTGELRRASQTMEIAIGLDGTPSMKTKVGARELCLYVQALNERNAMRKVYNMLGRKSVRKKLLNTRKNGQE